MNMNDKCLINKIEELLVKDNSYWDFSEYKKDHIHGIFTYPATMVPKMQSKILDLILDVNPSIDNLLDPFMGSGTILVEGILKNLNIYGIDINPLSYLISKVKIEPLELSKVSYYKDILFNNIDSNIEFDIVKFKDIDKWYKEEITYNLSKIKHCIQLIDDIDVRRFFWVCFCEIVRLSNNSQNSTFKLHIKPKNIIEDFNYDCIKYFKRKVEDNIEKLHIYTYICKNKFKKSRKINGKLNYSKKAYIYNEDSIRKLSDKRSFKNNCIDLIITSPPYGDNHTTVTYGQFSVLPLRWIDLQDIDKNINSSIVDTLNRIDSISLGGKNYNCNNIKQSGILSKSKTLEKLYNDLLSENEDLKAKKVASFIIDFDNTLKQMSRVLKCNCYMVLTVGNRRVNNRVVKFNTIIHELCKGYNLELIYEFNRNILNKRMPIKVSKLKNNTSVSSMNKEYILILKKIYA